MSATLPGNRKSKEPKRRFIVLGDEPTLPATRSPAALIMALLALLEAAPLSLAQLREALHEPEARLRRELTRMRMAGKVRFVRRRARGALWMLSTGKRPHVPLPPLVRDASVLALKPAATSSWWITATQEGFTRKASAEHVRRGSEES